MKNHAAMKENLYALYDGELVGAARREVELHLKGCLECRAVYARWEAAAEILFREPRALGSEFFVQRVMDRIEAVERKARPSLPWVVSLRWLVPAVGLAAALLFVIGRPHPAPVSIESLLLEDAGRPVSWVLSNEAPTEDDLLGFAMEGKG